MLVELGVTYFNPVRPQGWSSQDGDVEAEYMARCETVVMVFNRSLPAFAALAESGWAALGCLQRNQHFILQIDLDFPFHLPPELTAMQAGAELEKSLQGWATRSRYLVHKHAGEFKHPRLHLVEDRTGRSGRTPQDLCARSGDVRGKNVSRRGGERQTWRVPKLSDADPSSRRADDALRLAVYDQSFSIAKLSDFGIDASRLGIVGFEMYGDRE